MSVRHQKRQRWYNSGMCATALILLILLVNTSPNSFHVPVCEGAPPARIEVGERIVIPPDVGGLRLRALPAVDTGVLATLYANREMTVIGGPSCNGGYTWWRVELDNGLRGWIAEGSADGYFVMPLEGETRFMEKQWLFAASLLPCWWWR